MNLLVQFSETPLPQVSWMSLIETSPGQSKICLPVSPSVRVSQSKNSMVLSQPKKYFKNSVSRIIVPQYDLPCITLGLGEAGRFTNVLPNLFLEETSHIWN